MTETATPPKSFNTVHRIALVLLFLMMAQPTFDNIRALSTGVLGAGEMGVEVTVSQMIPHIVAMIVGWLGLWWFFKRQKRGAYLSIAAHFIGMIAVATQTPQLLEMFPPAALAVFFVILFAITLGPIRKFKEQYS
tara:strand:+ start:99 stop:503 length:405 start_codon:yes stop_codon:yes gene_type:complete